MRSLVLIGHGSYHSGQLHSGELHSGQLHGGLLTQALHSYAEQLRAQGSFQESPFDEVVEGYWQGEPSLRQVLRTVQFTDVTVVPMGFAQGPLTENVLPRELGLGHQGPVPPQGITRVMGGRTVHYTPPYQGQGDADLLGWLGHAATLGGDLDLGYQAAREALLRRADSGTLRLGEVLVSAQAGLFELRHTLDEGRSSESLSTFVTLAALWEQVHRAEDGQFRAQPALRTLARGWRAVVARAELPRALAYLYPAAVEESFAHHNHALRSTFWAATVQRRGLTPQAAGQEAAARRVLCSHCLKTPVWAGQALHQTFFVGVPGGIPCAEACPLFIETVSQPGRLA